MLNYRNFNRHWGERGYEPDLQKIIALAAPENLASRRVMEHLGIGYVREADHFGMHLVWYEIKREEYRSQTWQGRV
jgi:RimJ/RimL family protein N-acetyltransferase